jgi:hypothetical protein
VEKEASLSLSGGHEAESDTEHDTGTIGIVVVDDHESVRSSIARIVSLQEDMTLLGEASNGREALEVGRERAPTWCWWTSACRRWTAWSSSASSGGITRA